ncbi:MAG TPA: nucleotide sugar dehydrogenase [Acidimicrobiales bacterium]|nr:nucleotide sugar dehydrogenase [Acidimicrobiales bacterium]
MTDESYEFPDLGQPRVPVAVVGQGYVGLPLALAAAESGYEVVGIDLDADRVEQLNRGASPIADVSSSTLERNLASHSYRATASFSDVKACRVIVLCVPTPYRDQAPDLSHVASAAAQVGAHMGPGCLLILESTTYPGTTEEFLRPALESASGLTAGRDFDLAFSPERIDPGNPTFGIRNTPKIVGGTTPRATERAAGFYARFIEQVVPVSSPATAEMAKLLENVFRHINIALVNELAILCRDMNIDPWEVIDAAASKPFGFMPFYPGPGVGGHCIPVDPMYLSWRVRQFGGAAKFIDLARDVNDAMPLYCAGRVQDLLNEEGRPLKGAKVLILGVAYKPNVADVRESSAISLISALRRKGAHVQYHDPFVGHLHIPGGAVLHSVEIDAALTEQLDCIVIHTPHQNIDHHRVLDNATVIYDIRNSLRLSHPRVHTL